MIDPTRAQEKSKRGETDKAVGQRREHGDNRIPDHGQRQTASRADAVHEASEHGLPDRIRNSKCDRDVGVVRVGPVILEFEKGSEQRERLPVDVVDHCGSKQKTGDPPA